MYILFIINLNYLISLQRSRQKDFNSCGFDLYMMRDLMQEPQLQNKKHKCKFTNFLLDNVFFFKKKKVLYIKFTIHNSNFWLSCKGQKTYTLKQLNIAQSE